jgi:bacillithiol system protein YtxJ
MNCLTLLKNKVMGLFDMFKSQREIAKEEIKETPWHELSSLEQLDTLLEESKNTPVVVFKHSTRCGISKMVLRQFEGSFNLTEDQIKLYFLDLLNHRDVSNKIAEKFSVPHESPQLIVLKDGSVVHHDSHHGIAAEHLSQFV